jgi:predicted transcriptional regulator
MSQKRSKGQIIAEILTRCQRDGASKTKVVYASGLNFLTIKPYLATLDKNGLIEIVPGSYPLYRITQKGEDALVHLRALEKLIPIYPYGDLKLPRQKSKLANSSKP